MEIASFQLDTKEATDLVVLRSRSADRDLRLAARVRNIGFLPDYSRQFTIRSQAQGHGKTELEKIHAGYGDWFFYGHASIYGIRFAEWWLLDLDVFRLTLAPPFKEKLNHDGTRFHAYRVDDFPEELVIACRPLFRRQPSVRCVQCDRPMSVIRVRDICGICARKELDAFTGCCKLAEAVAGAIVCPVHDEEAISAG